MDRFELVKPVSLDQEAWSAIDSHRARLEGAVGSDDRALAVGSAKELAESIARVVLESTGETLGARAEFPKLIDTAQAQLGMRPADLNGRPDVRIIAQSALQMIKSVNAVRNDLGTGHGRALLPDPGLSEPTVSAVVDGTLLWARWALLILEPVLGKQPSVLIETVRGPASRLALQRALQEFDLSKQLPATQRQVGVIFGHRAAGGFGNAHVIGVNPAAGSDDLVVWPPEYRLGVVEGLLIDELGQITLSERYAGDIPRLLGPVGGLPQAVDRLAELVTKIEEAEWGPGPRSDREYKESSVKALRQGAEGLGNPMRGKLEALCSLLERS